MTQGGRRTFLVEYDSGVAEAEHAMAQKATWSLDTGRPGFSDGDNFVTNRVTLADYRDGRAASAEGVLGISAVFACVNLLAGTIASLPLMVYRTARDGARTVARDHSLYRLLHDSPNADQTASDFWEFAEAAIELAGNAYAEKVTAGERVSSLMPIRPDLMRVRRISNGDLEYRWTVDGVEYVRPSSRILHIRGFGGNPLGGASTLAVCRSAFGSALAVEQSAAKTFENGVRSSGAFVSDKSLDRAQMDEAEARITEKYVGAMNAGRPLLLNQGFKYEQITISPEDAQMLESRRFSVEEICRIFGVPPHMVGHTENSTSWGTGLEQQTLGFVKFTLRRRLNRIEQALEKQLLTAADRAAGITIEFNLEGLLRGDSTARSNFYQSGLTNGWMTINEVRALENLPPVEGGDVPRMQMQNVPITEAGQLPATGATQ